MQKSCQERGADIGDLVLRARLPALRDLPKEAFADVESVSAAVVIAASYGRVRALELFAARGVPFDGQSLCYVATLGDRVETLAYFQERGVETCTPETISIAVHHDCARAMNYWIDHGLIDAPIAVASQAIHHDAVDCFRALERVAAVRGDVGLKARARMSGPRLRQYLPADERSIQATYRTAPRYTFRTPSEHIDPNLTTIRFLLYRRFMRMLLVRN